MNYRTPLARVRGLGSAHEGARHWWYERLTSIASVPLLLFLICYVVAHLGASRAEGQRVVVGIFAHATGLLLLAHTGRMRKFGVSATDLMKRFVDNTIDALIQA